MVEWSCARYFARGRAHPRARPAESRKRAIRWELSSRASRFEGEPRAIRSSAIERRGRALRAEIGRKVEELAEEESRTLRDAAAERERLDALQQLLAQANQSWEAAHKRAVRIGPGPGSNEMRVAFEDVGASRARAQTLQEVIADFQTRVQHKESVAGELRRQIDELRAQLQRYSEALETDLAAGRDRIATRVREALG